MPTKQDYKAAAEEREAREQGRTLRHYTRKVASNLSMPRKRGKSTPSKRAA